MHHLSIDLETYSSVPLAKAGAQKYIQSPDFETLSLEALLRLSGLSNHPNPEYIKHAWPSSPGMAPGGDWWGGLADLQKGHRGPPAGP